MSSLPDDERRLFRRLRLLLVGLLICRGLVTLCIVPLFECWDEYEHVGYVIHVAETGRAPIFGQANVPRSLMAELVNYPLPRCVVDLQLGRLGARGYREYWGDSARRSPLPGAMELYEAQHAWWYYRLVAPCFQALGGVARLRWSVGGLRLLNLFFLAGALWVALGTLAKVARSTREAAWIGLALAVQPLLLINGVRVANDSLGVLFATLAIAGCLTLERSRWPWRCGAIGIAAGLAVLAKAVNFALVPFVALAWGGFVLRNRLSPGKAAVGGLILSLGFLAVTQDDLRSNLAQYGAPTPMQEGLVNRSRGKTTGDLVRAAGAFRWDRQVRRLWQRETFFAGGWSNQGPASGWITAYSIAVTAGLLGHVGMVSRLRNRGEPAFRTGLTPLLCVALCLSYSAALGYHTVQSYLAWGKPTTCPWYACAALPWFLALAMGGGRSWPVSVVRTAVPLVTAAICLSTEFVVHWGRMLPTYSGGATGLQALRRLAALQPTFLGTLTLVLAEVGIIVFLGTFLWSLSRSLPTGATRDELCTGETTEHRPWMSYTSPRRSEHLVSDRESGSG